MSVHALEHRTDFVGLEILDGTREPMLAGHRQELLAGLHALGVTRRDEAREGVDRGESGVACGHAVLAVRLEVFQKRDHVGGAKVVEVQIDHATVIARREEAEQEYASR